MKLTRLLIVMTGLLLISTCFSCRTNTCNSFMMSFWATTTNFNYQVTLQDFQDCNTLDAVDDDYGNHSARIYVKNNADYLWFAFRLKWEFNGDVVVNSTAVLSIDGDHDGYWAEDCKIIDKNVPTDGYYLRGNSEKYPDVDTNPGFEAHWIEIDARSEQGSEDEQLLFFTIPLTSDEFLYDMNIPDISSHMIGIGLLIENENETIRFFGQAGNNGNSSGFLTVSLASAGDVPAPEYQPGGGTSTTQTTTGDYETRGMLAAAPGFELLILAAAMGFIVFWKRKHSRRNQ